MAGWRIDEFITNDIKGVAVNRAKCYMYVFFTIITCSGFFTSGSTSLVTRDDRNVAHNRVFTVNTGKDYELPHSLCDIDECMMAPTRITPQNRQSEKQSTPRPRVSDDTERTGNILLGNTPVSWEYPSYLPESDILFTRSDLVMMAKILLGDAVISPVMRFATV